MTSNNCIQICYGLQRPEFELDVSVDIPMRGITGVFGASGAGKTTLLRCIAGLEQASTARLVVAGEVWQDEAAGVAMTVHDRQIGYVFQEPRLFRHLDVSDNLDYGRRRASPDSSGPDTDQVVELLGLERLLSRKPDELSGGEAQRVAIARALLRSPRFVLMDEPLASLDRARKDEILPFLDRLHAESQVPIIYVSHNIEEICRLCDHLIVIDGGHIIADGDLQSVLVRMDLAILAGAEAGSVIEGTVKAYDADDNLTRLSFSGGELWIPGRPGREDAKLRLRIRANDISLCRARPDDSTILNILPAVIAEIQSGQGPSVLVCVELGSDKVTARITRRSIRELGLKAGDQVFAQIKSVAVRSTLSE